MVLIVKLPQADLLERATTRQVAVLAGPTSATGWTTVWCQGEDELDTAELDAPYLDADDEYDGKEDSCRLHVGTGDQVFRVRWRRGRVDGHVAEAASTLADLFDRPELADEVRLRLERDLSDFDQVLEALAEVLDLPGLEEGAPEAASILFRGDPGVARIAAAVAGPALLQLDGRWNTLVATGTITAEDANPAWSLAAGLSGAAHRKPVLILWRSGRSSGWTLWRRGDFSEAWTWNDVWESSGEDGPEPADAAADALVKAFGPVGDRSLLYALHRRQRTDDDPIAELVSRLGLPASALTALDSPSAFSRTATAVPRTSRTAAALDYARSGDPATPPMLRKLYALLTVAAAVVAALMTVLSVTVLVTDGGFVDQDGTGASDWGWLLLFAVLTLVIGRIARRRIEAAFRA